MAILRFWSIIVRALRMLFMHPLKIKRGGENPVCWAIQRFLAEWKYESLAIDEPSFVAAVTGVSVEQVNDIYDECNASKEPVIARRKRVLYSLVRLLNPDKVVETGVGESTVAILLALRANGKQGQLFSIDLPVSGDLLADGMRYISIPPEERAGVPVHLRDQWHLLLGDAKLVLPDLLMRLKTIDIFLHDSLHTEAHMMFEYETAWPYLKQSGLLLSHDISVSFFKFCNMQNRRFYCTNKRGNRFGAVLK